MTTASKAMQESVHLNEDGSVQVDLGGYEDVLIEISAESDGSDPCVTITQANHDDLRRGDGMMLVIPFTHLEAFVAALTNYTVAPLLKYLRKEDRISGS